ncbi:unnamed protein product, partial [Iphiclides podalirius]
MESSFFEYRDATGVDDSDTEIIDDSLLEQSVISKKKSAFKNHTVYIAESEESQSEGKSDEDALQHRFSSKSITRRSSALAPTLISSSDDDRSKKGSIRRQSDASNKLVVSSSDEAEMSPELMPRRRPTKTPKRSSDSFIGRKTRKRMILIDSDTENSIVIEHNRNTKHPCHMDTPAKITGKDLVLDKGERDKSVVSDGGANSSEVASDSDEEESNDSKTDAIDDNDSGEEIDEEKTNISSVKSTVSHKEEDGVVGDSENDESSDEGRSSAAKSSEDNCDEFDEDQMVMSRATRMSIMGFVPKETPSDDSDFIQSDDNSSRPNSANSLADEAELHATVQATLNVDGNDKDDSRLTCSPITSPLKDVTNKLDSPFKNEHKPLGDKVENDVCDLTQNVSFDVYDLTGSRRDSMRSKVLAKMSGDQRFKENVIDDDVTIIDAQPEVIALSSDDDDAKEEKKSPKVKKSPGKADKQEPRRVSSDMKQYLLPPSYPNRVVYVTKRVRESELAKLQGLQQDLLNVRNILENMDVDTLPDGGVKLIERLTALEQDVRRQGDKVASMLVEPDNPTTEDIAKDGFGNAEEKGLSWEDLQKASNEVQPRMFGKQALATHMAERGLMLERLRDLHVALASRPPESRLAAPPLALRTPLMPHQLHALAWLRWRETQRPPGGILADDMGLGKTITMIALIAGDKESEADDEDDENDEPSGKSNSRLVRGGTLVVCPASLMQQWAEEVSRHCQPHRLSVCQHHGAARSAQPHRLAAHDLVLTTYNILLRDVEKKGPLCRVRWRRTILDEAHAVRNHKSATAGAVLPAALPARRRWALTGTPLHNKDLDLFALLRYLGCSPFDDLTMWKKWIDNKSLGGQERLSTIMRCIMLRRTKAQLQERGQLACLPSRDLHERQVTLTKEEMQVYQKLLVFSKTLFAQFLHQRAEKRADAMGPLAAGKDSAYAEMHKKMVKLQGAKPVKSHEILVLLLRLRQVCCHCGLIASMLSDEDAPSEELDAESAENDLLDELNKLVLEDKKGSKRKSGGRAEEGGEGGEEGEGAGEGSTAAEAVRSVLARNNPVFQLERPSSKIQAVMDCLNQNVLSRPGEKAVVVSQWTGVLRLVERELARAGVRSVALSGAVAVAARAALVAALNDAASPVRVMLLSLTAGGVGLNLCGASHLLLLDPHWNPQLEQQAQDRVYRVGQQRPVHIYRFMCLDTVEQSIRQLQRAKLEMADNVLTGARHNNASKLSIEDLKMLFNMGQ